MIKSCFTRPLCILILFLISVAAYSQTASKETEKISTFCKVWGFLKYYHPKVAKGSIDWDKEFMKGVKEITLLDSKKEINDFYIKWINDLGKIKVCKGCINNVPDSLKMNLDLKWQRDTTIFNDQLIQALIFIELNRNQKENYYVELEPKTGGVGFDNEKPYKDSIFPTPELRLLGLARYWNIVNYFYPYKYKIDTDWNKVLVEMIPKFRDAKDTVSYHLAMLELTTKINDSHAGFTTKYTQKYFGEKDVPFRCKVIDGKAIVSGIVNESFCNENHIRFGDIILSINDTLIQDRVKNISKYIGGSNQAAIMRNLQVYLFSGNTDSIKVSMQRDNVFIDRWIRRYNVKEFNYKSSVDSSKVSKMLEDNIGYVNMGFLKRTQVDSVMSKFMNTRAIIFDVRNYPQGTMYRVSKYLNDKTKDFAMFTTPDLTYPGIFHYTAPYICGSKNYEYYKGKVVLLFNERTQSHAEFTLMALQTAPNVVGVGSQTSGADGNVEKIVFPGGYETRISGIGVFYPDGRETQRIGIVPDVKVERTLEGIKSGKDEVLEKAIEVINGK